MLGLSDNGISFEEVLESIGLRKSLPPEYRKEYFERYIAEGQTDRIQGKGLPYE